MNGEWIELEKVIEILNSKWTWTKNIKCKYINLIIDTRDNMCKIKDRYNNYITLEDFMYQYGKDK